MGRYYLMRCIFLVDRNKRRTATITCNTRMETGRDKRFTKRTDRSIREDSSTTISSNEMHFSGRQIVYSGRFT